MPNFKPALISAVGQGNTIDVFAVSQSGQTLLTLHCEDGDSTGGWTGLILGEGLGATWGPPGSAPAALSSGQPSTNPVFGLQQKSGFSYIAQNEWFQGASHQALLPHSTSGPAAAWRTDGGLSVMAVGVDQYLFHTEFDDTLGWSNWFHVDFHVVVNSPPAMVSRANDRIDAFALGTDSKLGTDRAMLWTFGTEWVPKGIPPGAPGWDPVPLPPFQSLGGKFPVEPAGPAAASWGPERLDLFAVGLGPQYAMFHKWAEGPDIADTNAWHPAYPNWENVGGSFGSGPAVVSRGPNLLDIFALRLSDYQMVHKSWDPVHGWTPPNPKWNQVGDGVFYSAPAAVASSNPDRLDVFALCKDSRMYRNWSTDGGTTWLHMWVPLDSQTFDLGV